MDVHPFRGTSASKIRVSVGTNTHRIRIRAIRTVIFIVRDSKGVQTCRFDQEYRVRRGFAHRCAHEGNGKILRTLEIPMLSVFFFFLHTTRHCDSFDRGGPFAPSPSGSLPKKTIRAVRRTGSVVVTAAKALGQTAPALPKERDMDGAIATSENLSVGSYLTETKISMIASFAHKYHQNHRQL